MDMIDQATHFNKYPYKKSPYPEYHRDLLRVNPIIADAINVSQRFYLPYDINIVSDDDISANKYNDLIKLPFDCIALLTHTRFEGTNRGLVITIAFQRDGYFENKHGLHKGLHGELTNDPIEKEYEIGMLSLTYLPTLVNFWDSLPGLIYFSLERKLLCVVGRTLQSIITDTNKKTGTGEFDCSIVHEDIYALHNLCVMLSLGNVKTKKISPPCKLQKARERKGKAPLYSYHVLDVDGELWDGPRISTGEGQGKRSHLRRGHIRRLDERRRVWVRACLVHGSIPGFVDKDYKIKPPQINL